MKSLHHCPFCASPLPGTEWEQQYKDKLKSDKVARKQGRKGIPPVWPITRQEATLYCPERRVIPPPITRDEEDRWDNPPNKKTDCMVLLSAKCVPVQVQSQRAGESVVSCTSRLIESFFGKHTGRATQLTNTPFFMDQGYWTANVFLIF